MRKSNGNIKPSKPTPPIVPVDGENCGCTPSFLTEKRGEMDKMCGGAQADTNGQYVQPDDEKESGGEA